jgi:hypothetical protein
MINKQKHYAKFLFRLLILSFLVSGNLYPALAQRNLSLYNLQGAPQSYGLNPGRMPQSNGYLTIPAIGNLGASLSNTGFNYASITPEEDTTGTDNTTFFDNAFNSLLSGLKPENRLLLDFHAGWLDFGMRSGRNFFSLSASENINIQADYPKAIFELFNEISLGDTLSQPKIYDLSSMGLNILHYRSYALGFTRQITPRLSAGARIKYLDGLGSISTRNTDFQFENDALNAALNINGSLEVSSSGLTTFTDDGVSYLRGGGNTGMAFDLGASYSTGKLDLSASILNIGRITWKKDITKDTISSARFQFPTDDLDAFEAEYNRFYDSISIKRDSQAISSFHTTLPTVGYFSANYYFLPQTSANLLLSPRYFNGKVDLAFSVGAQTRISKILQVGLNYSAYNKNVFNLGASANLNLGPIQIFAATDNLPAALNWQKASNVHINAGLSLSFGNRTRAEQLAMWEQPEAEGEEEEESAEEENVEEPVVENTPKRKKQDIPQEEKPDTEEPKQNRKDNQDNKNLAVEKERKSNATDAPSVTPKPEIAIRRYFSLRGTAKDPSTGEVLKGIRVDAYIQLPDGGQQLAFTRNFFTGEFEVLMERDKTYRVIIHKDAFFDYEITVTPQQMQDKNELLQQVELRK